MNRSSTSHERAAARPNRTGSAIPALAVMLILGLALLIGSCSRSAVAQSVPAGSPRPGQEAGNSVPKADTAPPPHPLSIPGLRTRRFGAEEFTLLEPIPAADGLAAREFTYRSEGNLNYGLVEQPDGPAPPGGWPVIVVAHGYIPPDTYSTRDNYRLVTRYYAAGGFMVVKPDYRGHGRSEGRGGSFTRTIDYSIDVLNLIASLGEIPDADTENVFLYGHSMGGEIGLRILTVSDVLSGASIWAGVTEDFPENTLYFVRKRNPGEADRLRAQVDAAFRPEQLATITPNNYLDSIAVPLLVHHGTADESVPFAWSGPFRDRLDEAGVDYAFHEYPGENHNISASFYRVMDRDMAFFRELMD